MTMSHLDGNVLAGALSSLFAGDPTTLQVTCGACGAEGALAATAVERDEVAAIVRCRSCTHTLFTLVEDAGAVGIVVAGLGGLATGTGR